MCIIEKDLKFYIKKTLNILHGNLIKTIMELAKTIEQHLY